ncbi:SDR family oxidoreductase [Patescibacteria group bacterium]
MKLEIIATGLSGLVGSRVKDLLGDDFIFLDYSLPKHNLLDEKGLRNFFQAHQEAKIVLHLAAFTDVKAAWQQRGDQKGPCWQVNVQGTKNLAYLCQKQRKYLIFISTDYVFAGQRKKLYTEVDLPNPIEWYGQTKYLAEKEVLENCSGSAIVRIAFPYRARFKLKKDLVRTIIDGLETRQLYSMFIDQIITPTFVDDIAFGLKEFFLKQPKGIYHLVGSRPLSPSQLACQVAKTFGYEENLVKKGSLKQYLKNQPPNSRPWHSSLALSNQKIKQKLGIKMSFLSEGLQKMKAQRDESPT